MGGEQTESVWRRHSKEFIALSLLLVGAFVVQLLLDKPERRNSSSYPWHHNVTATVFWVGEEADQSNGFIHNNSSTWVRDWVGAFGGVDDPNSRCGYAPCGFVPHENPFYAALPYNDLQPNCQPKDSQASIYWFQGNTPAGQSLLKNRWIEIKNGNQVAYAQLQDAGPFGEDDVNYVFGHARPKEKRAGLDLSPAAANYISLNMKGEVSWRFVDEHQVPDGDWKKTVTRTEPDC